MIKTRRIEASRGAWLVSLLALLALPAAMLAVPGVARAGNISVVMSVELAASPREVWKTIGPFDKLQDWHPAVESSTIDGPPTKVGSVRTLHLKGGGEIHEQLTSYNDLDTRLTYRMLDSPLPIRNYESFLAVTHTSGDHALVIWGSTFDAAPGATDAKAKSVIQGIYKAGFDDLKKKFGAVMMKKKR